MWELNYERFNRTQVAFRSQASGVVFNIAGARKFFTRPAEPA
jgi:hypothetical protein